MAKDLNEMATPDDDSDPLASIRLIVNNATPATSEVKPAPAQSLLSNAPGAAHGGDPIGPHPAMRLPKGCPVTPLGKLNSICFYLDASNQLRQLPERDHTRLHIMGMFGPHADLLWTDEYWPRKKQVGDGAWITTGWQPDEAAKALMVSAAARGLWNPTEKVRGRGAWLGDRRQLILHCGDAVFDGETLRDPGMIGKYVYPAGEGIMRPWEGGPAGKESAAALLKILQTWAWRRAIDPLLIIGWIGASMIGGALKWRPVLWATGGKGTGKSTLQEMLRQMMGGSILSYDDPSSAGLWQRLEFDALPVALDEREAETQNQRSAALVQLARIASSGGKIVRGGAGHEPKEFTARSCFLFSSIRIPPLLSQDRSRIAICGLNRLKDPKPPTWTAAEMEQLGRKLLRRMVDGWPRLAQALEQYRIALHAVGHDSRGADVFGTLLACADLLLNDREVDSDSAQEWAKQLDVMDLPEAMDDTGDDMRCLQHLLTTVIPLDSAGAKNMVSEWLRQAVVNSAFDEPAREADRILGNCGIKVIRPKNGKKPTHFAIANYHAGLDRVFAGTHWAGRSGALGVWVQAFRELPGAQVDKQRFAGGAPMQGTAIPLELVFPAGVDAEAPAQRSFATSDD